MHDLVFHAGDRRREDVGELDAVARRIEIHARAEVVDLKIPEVLRLLDALFESLDAFAADERVRVLPGRHLDHAHDEILRGEFAEGSLRGLEAGGVGVEAQDDLLRAARDDAGVIAGECGPQRGDDVLDAELVAGDEVELPLADDRFFCLRDRAPGLVESEEGLALDEQWRLGRVHVLRHLRVGVEDAPAEGDDVAELVGNREHDPIPETRVEAAGGKVFISQGGEPALHQEVCGEPL